MKENNGKPYPISEKFVIYTDGSLNDMQAEAGVYYVNTNIRTR